MRKEIQKPALAAAMGAALVLLALSAQARAAAKGEGPAGQERLAAQGRAPKQQPAPRAERPAGEERAAREERPGMAYVPAGEFPMGSAADDPDVYDWEKEREQPQHPVHLKAFYIDRTEVTNKAYDAFRPGRERSPKSACDDCPATKVSWFEAKAYCEAQKKRLPTEAEWEKAAKAGSGTRPEPFDEYAWFSRNSIESAKPVGQKKPNAYGLHDMLGNVREWTADWYDPAYYQKRVRDDPRGPETGARRVERGGAFFLPRKGVTPTIRYNHPPDFTLYFLGFRCAQDP